MDLKTITLGISALVALYSIHRNTQVSRKRATVDLVLHQKNDQALSKANKLVNPLLKSNRITSFADDSQKDTAERAAILDILNNYEFIAVGMREGAFDLQVYIRMSYGTVTRDWKCFEPFVCHLREVHQRPTLFQEFEWLHSKFKQKKLRVDKS